jgi:hypothetical protein
MIAATLTLALASPALAADKPAAARAKVGSKTKAAPAKPVAAVPVVETSRSEPAERLLAWIATTHDNGTAPFIVIDKQAARLFLFAPSGKWLGDTPVLIGIGVGDDSSPGIGAKSLGEIGPAERTTPAGRFVAKFGKAFGNERVLWVDYANSVALHAVITTNKKEKRVARLLSEAADDNRITFGCINVGTSFYTRSVRPAFQKSGGVVYILPDTKTLDDVFPHVRMLPYLQAAATL